MIEIIKLDKIDSTNDYAHKLASEGCAHGTVVVADSQTKGRGRLGREWVSPAGENIYMSVVLRPELTLEQAQSITLLCGVAAVRGIRKSTKAEPALKWPNDITLGGLKLGGILVESRVKAGGKLAHVVAGIGINVNSKTAEFPPEVRDIATSLLDETGKTYERFPIVMAVAECLLDGLRELEQSGNDAMLDAWRNMDITLSRRVRVDDSGRTIEGRAVDIDSRGGLVVQLDNGDEVTIAVGDVTVLGDA